MAAQSDVNYRRLVTLGDGARVLLRLLTAADRQALLDLYAPTTADDARYMRHDVRSPKLVESWIDELDYDRVLPLVAVVGERIVGNTTLHFGTGPTRHLAEIHIFLAKDFRRRGLGVQMVQTHIELARRRGLHFIHGQIVTDQASVIKAFQQMGFQIKCTLDNFFMMPDGDLRDTVLVVFKLMPERNEF
jgi:L-amino acid N-acyltransferase YncA